jgi:hypothetical protein
MTLTRFHTRLFQYQVLRGHLGNPSAFRLPSNTGINLSICSYFFMESNTLSKKTLKKNPSLSLRFLLSKIEANKLKKTRFKWDYLMIPFMMTVYALLSTKNLLIVNSFNSTAPLKLKF